MRRLNWRAALRRCRFVILIGLLHSLSADDVIVRTQLSPETIWVGQRMLLRIDVLGKDGWAQIADLSELEVPGSYVRPAGNSRVRLNETINGESFSGQRYELSVYPQRPGQQELPAIDLNVRVQTWGANGGTQEHAAQTEPISFTTEVPTGADPKLPLIVTTEFKATQIWEPDQTDFKIGDALKRHITLTAKDLPAMVLPPLHQAQIEGVSTYSENPQLEEKERTAVRKESITLVFEQNASPSLPSYELQWWNPESEKLELITLEGRSLSITGGGIAVSTPQTVTNHRLKIALSLLTAGLIITAYLILRRHKARQQPPQVNEPTVFKQVIQAAQSGNPSDTLNRLMVWLDCIGERPSHFFAAHADASTQTVANRLLCDPQADLQLGILVNGLKQARKRYRATQRPLSKADAVLPPLNL